MKADLLMKRHGSTHLAVVQLPEDDSEFQIDELLEALISEFEETSVVDLLGGVPEGMLPAEIYEYGASENKKPCRFCLNARVDPELSDDNDLSYVSLGHSDNGFRILQRAGAGRIVEVEFERWDESRGEWCLVGFFRPKFCPECGRPLMDDYPEWRSMYG